MTILSRPVLQDDKLEQEFQEMGYVTVPFLSKEEVAYLTDEYFSTRKNSKGSLLANEADFDTDSEITYDFTFIDRNSDYKREVFEIISKAFDKLANGYLNNYKPIIANYIFKKQNGGEVPLHQNWAFVDERNYTSVSIWCPLVDSFRENGTLEMVDRSHKRFGEIRGPMIPWEVEGIKEHIIENHLTPMNIKAGEAVILDDSILHYSHNNLTGGLRLAIQLILIPAECESIHHHRDVKGDKDHVHILEVDQDFYMTFHPWKKPKGQKKIKTEKYREKSMTLQEFDKIWKGPRYDEAQNGGSFLDRISKIFSTRS
jgi:ectoine hydroxylase-related dioxygenase (phytanoyl-CoA dioxygenase family)